MSAIFTLRLIFAIPRRAGIYEETPKTGETRYIPIPAETVTLLREYRAEQEKLRELNGDRWQNDEGFLFTRDDGQVMHPDSITAWLNKFSRRHGLAAYQIRWRSVIRLPAC